MKIIFVCFGNICRSPMAEYIFKNKIKKAGIDDVDVCSRATSAEEEGNPCHHGTREILFSLGIDCSDHVARRITKKECDEADLLICMDMYNVWHLREIAGKENDHKIKRLLEFSPRLRDIDDPWYTHDFNKCYDEITEGLGGLYKYIRKKK